ncbi:hypothetical protein [Photobacterium angustum]|uniref:Uncharacterized protein n=1 Tax=Photobacterium angustum TaxID=661 RepID=A0ABX5GXY8_PHOAN|nr:hypothetical protein [Photobacterium angustum]PSX01658.1 hypothetical protein C0W27_21970 [Photobacterium angustum]
MSKINKVNNQRLKTITFFLLDAQLVDNVVLSQMPMKIDVSFEINELWTKKNVIKNCLMLSNLLIQKLEKLFKKHENFSFTVNLMRPDLTGNKNRIFTALLDILVKDSQTNKDYTIASSVTFKT